MNNNRVRIVLASCALIAAEAYPASHERSAPDPWEVHVIVEKFRLDALTPESACLRWTRTQILRKSEDVARALVADGRPLEKPQAAARAAGKRLLMRCHVEFPERPV